MSTVDFPTAHATQTPQDLYLDLLKVCLTRYAFGEPHRPLGFNARRRDLRSALYWPVSRILERTGYDVVKRKPFDSQARYEGTDWPPDAETMVGIRRLSSLQRCVVQVLLENIPGDLVEAGVWRGGTAIFMRAVLRVYGDRSRRVWACDSFKGLPAPDPKKYPFDAGDRLWDVPALAVPLETVQANFARYGLLDAQVRFLRGWFRDSMPTVPIQQIAVLRLDCDMYESTMDVLRHLYPKVSLGGWVIIDDYGVMPNCKQAVDDFRAELGITEKLDFVGHSQAQWRRNG